MVCLVMQETSSSFVFAFVVIVAPLSFDGCCLCFISSKPWILCISFSVSHFQLFQVPPHSVFNDESISPGIRSRCK